MLKTHTDRRTFLKWTGLGAAGLIVGCSGNGDVEMMPDPSTIPPDEVEKIFQALHTWIRIATDGTIEISVHKAEMGQGVHTTLPLIVAEELDADFSQVEARLVGELPPFSLGGGLPMTYGSTSVSSSYEAFRKVGAAARAVLRQAAASRWNLPLTSTTTSDSKCYNESGESLTYAELAVEASKLELPENPELKDPSSFKLIGKNQPRLQDRLIVDGKCEYGADIQLENRLYAAIRHAPVLGGKPLNTSSLSSDRPGVKAIVELPNAIAVVAESFWEAKIAVETLPVQFSEPAESTAFNSKDEETRLADALQEEGTLAIEEGDVSAIDPQTTTKLTARYFVPHLAHVSLEPVTATAHVTANKCELWLPTQSAYFVRRKIVEVTGLSEDQIVIHPTFLGGGFGRKVDTDYPEAAVRIAQVINQPVTLIWSREEDIRNDQFRPLFVGEINGYIDENKRLVGWEAVSAGPSVLGFGGGDPLSVQGFKDIPYNVSNLQVRHVNKETIVESGFWRSIGHTQNTFFVESFMDEAAAAANQDPYDMRMTLLSENTRVRNVVEKAARLGNWGTPNTQGASQGIAVCEDYGSVLALVCEVTVDEEAKKIRVHRMSAVVDCGTVMQPSGVLAQVEGGLLFGLSAALYEEITIEGGVVQQSNFSNYPVLTPSETPEIVIEIVQSNDAPGGMGEIAVGPVAPAIANAIYTHTGTRCRRLPLQTTLFSG